MNKVGLADLPPRATAENLAAWLLENMALLVTAINTNSELQQLAQNNAPTKPRIGQLAYADGVNWNPGGGEGTYEYTSTGWVKLGNLVTTETTINEVQQGQVLVDLGRRKNAGTFVFQPAQPLPSEILDRPVFIQQATLTDEDEFGLVFCAAEIISSRKIRVRWVSVGDSVTGQKLFNYFIPY